MSFVLKLKGRIATGFCAVVQFLLESMDTAPKHGWLMYIYIYILV